MEPIMPPTITPEKRHPQKRVPVSIVTVSGCFDKKNHVSERPSQPLCEDARKGKITYRRSVTIQFLFRQGWDNARPLRHEEQVRNLLSFTVSLRLSEDTYQL